jgi:autotransporter adhesin
VLSVAGTGGDRRITGVAPGAVSANSTQAVNGAQLYQVENELNQTLGVDVVRNSYGAAASAMAQSGIPQTYEAGRSMVALGVGSTGGQSALALGVSRITDNGRWVMKLNGSVSTTDRAGVGGGIGYQW